MKIHLVSDLHVDVWRDYAATDVLSHVPQDLAPVLVVAGDVCEVERMTTEQLFAAFEKLRQKAKDVIYVPGNHEPYRMNFEVVESALKHICDRLGIWYLDNDTVEIGFRRFVGSTLWYDPGACAHMGRDWSDYSIRRFDDFIPQAHQRGKSFLRASVKRDDVVVTHMLPSWKSIAPKYAGMPTNVFFVTPMEGLIQAAQPALWLHGHTHVPCDYKFGRTRVVCASLGVPFEVAAQISPEVLRSRLSYVIEI